MKKKLLEKSVLFMALCMFGGQDAFGMLRRVSQVVINGVPKTMPRTTSNTTSPTSSPKPTYKASPIIVEKSYNGELNALNDRTFLDSNSLGTPESNPSYGAEIYIFAKNNNMTVDEVYEIYSELVRPENKKEGLPDTTSVIKTDLEPLIVSEEKDLNSIQSYEEMRNSLSLPSFLDLSYFNLPYQYNGYIFNQMMAQSKKSESHEIALEGNVNNEVILISEEYENTMSEMEVFLKGDKERSIEEIFEIANKAQRTFRKLSEKVAGYEQSRTLNLLHPMITSCFIEVASSAIFDKMFSDAVDDQSVYNKFQDFERGLNQALGKAISSLNEKIAQMQERIDHAHHLDKEKLLIHLNKELDLRQEMNDLKNKIHQLSEIEKKNFLNHSYFYSCSEAILAELFGMGKENLSFLKKYTNGLVSNTVINHVRSEEVSLIDYLEKELKIRLDEKHDVAIENLLKEIKKISARKYQTQVKIGVDIYSDGLIEKILSKNPVVKLFSIICKKTSLHKAEEKVFPTKARNNDLDKLDIDGTLNNIIKSFTDEINSNFNSFEKEEELLIKNRIVEDEIKEDVLKDNTSSVKKSKGNKHLGKNRSIEDEFRHIGKHISKKKISGFSENYKTMERLSLQRELEYILDQLSNYQRYMCIVHDISTVMYSLPNDELKVLINHLTILMRELSHIDAGRPFVKE